jgi:hypothetical protein
VGYRNFTDRKRFDAELAKLTKEFCVPGAVVSGGATGADTLARNWARDNKIPMVEHKPTAFASYALLKRNTKIVNDSDRIIAFLSKKSRGTHDTINKAKAAKKQIHVIQID